MQFSFGNKAYDVLKAVAQIWLPAAGTLYFALSGIWGLPATEQVIGTITAVDTFLGVVLGLSSKGYMPDTAGHIVVDDSHPLKTTYQIQLKGEPDVVFGDKKHVTLSVGTGKMIPEE